MGETITLAELRRMRQTAEATVLHFRTLLLPAQTEGRRARIEFQMRSAVQHLRDIDAVLEARAGR